jgi:hypothetical protein
MDVDSIKVFLNDAVDQLLRVDDEDHDSTTSQSAVELRHKKPLNRTVGRQPSDNIVLS